jgi:hypothetical protein
LQSIDSEALLRSILKISPSCSVHEVRMAHPVFRAMSYDHLSLRLAQAGQTRAGTGDK